MRKQIGFWGATVAVALALLMMATVLLLPAAYAEGVDATTPEYKDNFARCRDASRYLYGLWENYEALDYDLGHDVFPVVQRYVNRLGEMYEHAEFSTRYLTNEIELLKSKGVVAAEVAWIYYGYIRNPAMADRLTANGRAAVDAAYESLQSDILAATNSANLKLDASYTEEAGGGHCARMYVAVYSGFLEGLLRDGDSEAVQQKVLAAKARLKTCTVTVPETGLATTGETYEAVFAEAVKAVTDQRNQDAAMKQLKDCFVMLFPEEDPMGNETILAALALLDDDATSDVTVMNATVAGTVGGLLENLNVLGGGHVSAYVADRKDAMAELVATADEAGQVAVLTPCFVNHGMDYLKAFAKDLIEAYAAEMGLAEDLKVQDIIAACNSAGGLIDKCGDAEAVDYEVARACLRVDLRAEYLYAENIITLYGGGGEGQQELLDRIAGAYAVADDKIESNSPAPTWEAILAAYDECIAVFNEATADAEVVAFMTVHKEIIDKPKDQITLEDRDKLNAAVQAITDMNDRSREVLAQKHALVASNLADKYKIVARLLVAEHLQGEARETYVNDLKAQIGEIYLTGEHPNHMPAFREAVDGVVEKAASIDRVYDRLEEIAATEDYETFADSHKAGLNALAKTSAEGIKAAVATEEESIAEVLAGLTAEALLSLDRAEACARLDAKAASRTDQTAATKAEVQAILEEVKAAIQASADAEEIAQLTSAALLDLEQAFTVQDMTAEADALKASINGLASLTDEEKADLCSRVDALLAEEVARARESADAETLALIASALHGDLVELGETANTVNAISAAAAEAKATVNALGFLTVDEKKAYTDQIAELTAAGKENAYTDPTYGMTEFSEGLTALVSEATEANGTAAQQRKTAAVTEIETCYDEAMAAIEACPYLSDEERAALEQRAADVLTEMITVTEKASSSAEVLTAKLRAQNALTAVEGDAATQDAAAKAAQTAATDSAVRAAYNLFLSHVNGMEYLADAQKAKLREDAAAILAAFESEVAAVTSPADIQAAQTKAEIAFEALLAQGDADNLAAAKVAAVNELVTERDKTLSIIDKFLYLSHPARDLLRAETEDLLTQGTESIRGATDLDAVSAAKNAAKTAMSRHAAEAQAQEDEACVSILSPIVMVLGIVAAVELLAVAVLALLCHRQAPAMRLTAFVPVTALPVMSLTMTPVTAWVLLVVLALADVGMAVAIVYLAVRLYRNRSVGDFEEADGEEIADGIRILREPRGRKQRTLPEPEPMARLAGPKLIYLMPPAEVMPAQLMETVTLEEADELISDEDALHYEESDVEDTEVYRGRKKAEINIDVIARHFEAGEKVTLNTLKEKGLLPKQVGHVKVLARGSLDKPLTIIAQGFSASAVKMIVLTGGTAILTEGAPERWSWMRRRTRRL